MTILKNAYPNNPNPYNADLTPIQWQNSVSSTNTPDTQIMALLGDITFTAITGFTSFEQIQPFPYVEHKKIGGLPNLQLVGESPREIVFELRLHQMIEKPEDAILRLRSVAKKKQSVSFIYGDRYKGMFVIKEVVETVKKTHSDGTLLWVDVKVTLLEDNKPLEDNSGSGASSGGKKGGSGYPNNPNITTSDWVANLGNNPTIGDYLDNWAF